MNQKWFCITFWNYFGFCISFGNLLWFFGEPLRVVLRGKFSIFHFLKLFLFIYLLLLLLLLFLRAWHPIKMNFGIFTNGRPKPLNTKVLFWYPIARQEHTCESCQWTWYVGNNMETWKWWSNLRDILQCLKARDNKSSTLRFLGERDENSSHI